MVQRVPLIVADPSPSADVTRGSVEQRFVESVDIVPTLLESLGIERATRRLEGASLLPLLHGSAPAWRDTVFSELDYSFKEARRRVGKTPHNARAYSPSAEPMRTSAPGRSSGSSSSWATGRVIPSGSCS